MTNEVKTAAVKKPAKAKAGKYIASTGKRKTASAQVRLIEQGTGIFIVNGKIADTYFSESELALALTPIKLVGLSKEYDISVLVVGGGKKGQAEAIRHGIAKNLLEINPELRASLKANGWLTRDARIKERKKPGLRRARRAPQWSKR